jgi:hypothetical protein
MNKVDRAVFCHKNLINEVKSNFGTVLIFTLIFTNDVSRDNEYLFSNIYS